MGGFMDKFEKYLNEKENEYNIKLALTDTTAVTLNKKGINKKNEKFEDVNSQESNKQLSTLGDSIIKFYLCSYLMKRFGYTCKGVCSK